MYKFDFASQKGTCVFKCGIPDSDLSPQLMVRGELVMAFYQRRNQIILFNWKNSEAVILDYHHVNIAVSTFLHLDSVFFTIQVSLIMMTSMCHYNCRQSHWGHLLKTITSSLHYELNTDTSKLLPSRSPHLTESGQMFDRLSGNMSYIPFLKRMKLKIEMFYA